MKKHAQLLKQPQRGTVKRHPDGFGFFIPENSDVPDVYIPKQFMLGIMTNDRIEIQIYPEPGGQRFRGEVLKILDHSFKVVVGRYKSFNEMYGIIFDTNSNWGANLSIPIGWSMDAKDDDLVVVQITSYPEKKEPFLGRIIEILGNSEDPLFDIKKVIYSHKLPHVFDASIEKESQAFPKDVSAQNYPNRRNITQLPLITIDGQTAKDFDDAVYVESQDFGFRLVVAIADVSHYVKINSAIDQEAYKRGTSTYFPNFVVPMLPEVLSNELCSLKPQVERLCFVADLKINYQGDLIGSEFYEAVMKSHARVTYGEAEEVIEGHTPEKLKAVAPVILKAADLAKILMAKRFREGALDLEIAETELIIDELGNPVDIQKSERIFSHKLIEEMMLMANVAVAKFIGEKHEEPMLYRIHEPPKLESIEILNHYLKNFGSSRKIGTHKIQKEIGRALQEFVGRPEETILHILTLRSMNQAKYSPENVGHFGLGFDFYTHFTSPIRRYPDLVVHRTLKNLLKIPGYEVPTVDTLETAGTLLSACEQRSVKAERQLQSIKKARFMKQYLGEEFEGIISSVAKFGAFVLLRKFDVDGLIKVEELGDDLFIFDSDNMILSGKRSGFQYRIGDSLKIQVVSCDVDLGQINFALATQPQIFKKSKGGSSKSFSRKKPQGERSSGHNKKGNRSNSKKRRKDEDHRGGSGKARVSKRSRKGKTR